MSAPAGRRKRSTLWPMPKRLLPFVVLLCSLGASAVLAAAPVAPRPITIATAGSALVLAVAPDGRLQQIDYGRPRTGALPDKLAPEDEAYPASGSGWISEPALQVVHADGNTSTELAYVDHETRKVDGNVTHTRIRLKDRYYPFFVTLHFEAFAAEDVIRQWVELTHSEAGAVVLSRFASSAPVIKGDAAWLTQFQGDYMREMELVEERLTPGLKILDSKLGVRAHQMRNPSFVLAVDSPAAEESGEVVGGTLAWSGSFQLAFEIDHARRLRVLAGINPFGAAYRLPPGKTFTTPAMLWTWSAAGKGRVSRNFHRWARRYGLRDGAKPRPVLLNNWEATHFTFDEAKLVSLFDGAKELGAELFLLDDGWFGNKHPRDDDEAGLGDWEVNARKLPHGLGYLAAEARKRGLGFGIWLEPEMVNPRSELYERHPDWVIAQPHRELRLSRHQLVLDLTRPEAKEHAWQAVERTLGAAPGIGYLKWDANRYVTQPGSSHLPPEAQQHLLVDYQWALYDVMERMAKKFPGVMAMACAGGPGRVDYGALRYFHSFWPSDNTDPVQRIFIQWGFSHVFPANAIAAHVTDMGHKPTKLAVDVALAGAFGVDRDVAKMTAEERAIVAAGARLYKERLRPLVGQGDLYRLESPYERPRAALEYVAPDRASAVVFVYQLREAAPAPVRPRGLDPARRYRVRELNLPPGARSRLELNDRVLDGATLMERGFAPPLRRPLDSAVIELAAEPPR
jgi:alpha-galactosidase